MYSSLSLLVFSHVASAVYQMKIANACFNGENICIDFPLFSPLSVYWETQTLNLKAFVVNASSIGEE
jgi:hypothetical protein